MHENYMNATHNPYTTTPKLNIFNVLIEGDKKDAEYTQYSASSPSAGGESGGGYTEPAPYVGQGTSAPKAPNAEERKIPSEWKEERCYSKCAEFVLVAWCVVKGMQWVGYEEDGIGVGQEMG